MNFIFVFLIAAVLSDVNSQLINAIAPRFKRIAGNQSIDEPIDELNSTSYIIGGSTAQQGAYPWTVRLEVYYPGVTSSYGVCGAALWNKNHIVTAAHCFRDCNAGKQAENIKVCIGDYDQYDQNDGQACYWANQWWWHPNYVYCDNRRLKNDIAVIRISNGMRVPYWGPNNVGNANFAYAPNNNLYEGTATLTGWGQTNPDPNQSPNFPSRMKVVNLPLMNTQQCRQYHDVDDGQICAGGINGQNSCRGDSGGPLVWPNNGWSTLIGLSSYGPAVCASGGIPNVFTRVAFYSPWIKSIAGNMENPARRL